MINGSIFGKCFRSRSSRGNPRISPLAPRYEYPQQFLLTTAKRTGHPGSLGLKELSRASRSGESPLGTLRFFHSNVGCAGPCGPANPKPRAPDPRPRGPGTQHRGARPNYELFNCNKFNVLLSSRNYRGCWHLTCPRLDPLQTIYIRTIRIPHPKRARHS